MEKQQAIREARDRSLRTYRMMWVWQEDAGHFWFDVAIPKGKKLFARVIGDELWRWEHDVLVYDRIIND